MIGDLKEQGYMIPGRVADAPDKAPDRFIHTVGRRVGKNQFRLASRGLSDGRQTEEQKNYC